MTRHYDGPTLFDVRCEVCDRVMVYTGSGYLSCPKGHGQLKAPPGTCSAPPVDMFEGSITAGHDCEQCGGEVGPADWEAGSRLCDTCWQAVEDLAAS